MNANLATQARPSRNAIMAQLATVLRSSAESTTNIESAIAQASVSTRDISDHFGSNRELIVAMVAQLSDAMATPLATSSTKADLRLRLLEFGQRVSDTYASSHLRSLYRIAITESIRHTGLGRDFYEAGPGRLTHCLADFLRRAQAEGVLGAADPQLLASHFIAALRAQLELTDTYSLSRAPGPASDGSYFRDVVDLFFHGIDRRRQPC